MSTSFDSSDDQLEQRFLQIALGIREYHKTFRKKHLKQLICAKWSAELCQRSFFNVALLEKEDYLKMKGTNLRREYWEKMADQGDSKMREKIEGLKITYECEFKRHWQQCLDFVLSEAELYSNLVRGKKAEESKEALVARRKEWSDQDSKELIEEELIEEALENAKKFHSSRKNTIEYYDKQILNKPAATSRGKNEQLFKGDLKNFQHQGLQWLQDCYDKGLNAILADEIGLGKRILTIAFLAYLAGVRDLRGPFLVVTSESTLKIWETAIGKYCPDMKRAIYTHQDLTQENLYARDRKSQAQILIASYQTMLLDDWVYLKSIAWRYMVLDNVFSIEENLKSISWERLFALKYRNRLLLIDQPIENDIAHMLFLISFTMPGLFNTNRAKSVARLSETLNKNQQNRLNTILEHFILQRGKDDVKDDMTKMEEEIINCEFSNGQREVYETTKSEISCTDFLKGNREQLDCRRKIIIQLRKVCNHLCLAKEPSGTFPHPNEMLEGSAKLQRLDKLLETLKAENHHVLLFAQMTEILEILETFLKFKYNNQDCKYIWLRSSKISEDILTAISKGEYFIILLSTSFGGRRIDLTVADTVILYEGGWNPTWDLRAINSSHRIHQKKDVKVYRLICKNTVEEKILSITRQKSTEKQLVATVGHEYGDLVPDDVVSLLMDDADLEQKLKENLFQEKERLRKGKEVARG